MCNETVLWALLMVSTIICTNSQGLTRGHLLLNEKKRSFQGQWVTFCALIPNLILSPCLLLRADCCMISLLQISVVNQMLWAGLSLSLNQPVSCSLITPPSLPVIGWPFVFKVVLNWWSELDPFKRYPPTQRDKLHYHQFGSQWLLLPFRGYFFTSPGMFSIFVEILKKCVSV